MAMVSQRLAAYGANIGNNGKSADRSNSVYLRGKRRLGAMLL